MKQTWNLENGKFGNGNFENTTALIGTTCSVDSWALAHIL